MSDDFLKRFVELVSASGWRAVAGPSQLIERWDEFVARCEEGYDETIYEYENDRAVRDLLESVLTDPFLQQYKAIPVLRQSVDAADARFRATCRNDVQIGRTTDPWWRRCVPTKASGEFAEDLTRFHNITSSHTDD